LNLYRHLIQGTSFVESQFDDDKELITRVVDDTTSLISNSFTPILFIGPWDIYTLLDSARWGLADKGEEFPFTVRKDDGYPDNYLCHVNEIEVYQMPFNRIGFSILVGREGFKHVSVRRVDHDQFVDVSFIEDETDRSTGTLKLSYWLKSTFRKVPAFKYISKHEDE